MNKFYLLLFVSVLRLFTTNILCSNGSVNICLKTTMAAIIGQAFYTNNEEAFIIHYFLCYLNFYYLLLVVLAIFSLFTFPIMFNIITVIPIIQYPFIIKYHYSLINSFVMFLIFLH